MARGHLIKPIVWYVAPDVDGVELRPVTDVFMWVPMLPIREVVDGFLVDCSCPMFPDYVLLGSRHRWRYIERAMPIRLLRTGRKPQELPEPELARIRMLEAYERNVEPVFQRGEHVRVRARVRSAYAGLRGRFLRVVWLQGGKFASVCLDLFGEDEKIVKIPADYLEVVR